jgi:hypothetical protein
MDNNPWKIQSTANDWGRTRLHQPTAFCHHCLDLNSRNYNEDMRNHYGTDEGWLGFRSSLDILEKRESQGCQFCSTLLEGIMLFRRMWESVPDDKLELFVVASGPHPRIELTFKPSDYGYNSIKVLDLEYFSETGR